MLQGWSFDHRATGSHRIAHTILPNLHWMYILLEAPNILYLVRTFGDKEQINPTNTERAQPVSRDTYTVLSTVPMLKLLKLVPSLVFILASVPLRCTPGLV